MPFKQFSAARKVTSPPSGNKPLATAAAALPSLLLDMELELLQGRWTVWREGGGGEEGETRRVRQSLAPLLCLST